MLFLSMLLLQYVGFLHIAELNFIIKTESILLTAKYANCRNDEFCKKKKWVISEITSPRLSGSLLEYGA